VREWFDEGDKAQLNSAITGESICPRGNMIDETTLKPELRAKIALHFPVGKTPRVARGAAW
jgi:hypothetical protein